MQEVKNKEEHGDSSSLKKTQKKLQRSADVRERKYIVLIVTNSNL